MKTSSEKFTEAIRLFPKLMPVLDKLNEAGIEYRIGGSLALYTQGNGRKPHDVDIMFPLDDHKKANRLFGISAEYIERPNVTMLKSTPVDDGSIDFLSDYTVIADGKKYHSEPYQKIEVKYQDRPYQLIPAEKIAVIKLIGRRTHHQDLEDVAELVAHPDFDKELFQEMIELLQAQEIVAELRKTYKL